MQSIISLSLFSVTSACDTCLEMGPQFALHVPEKALYLQADLVKDTDRMFHTLQTTSKVNICIYLVEGDNISQAGKM